ncbi:MAG: Ig domain-containing protein [Thermofilaceae archaeon]
MKMESCKNKLLVLLITIYVSSTIVLAQITIKPDKLPNASVGVSYEVQLYTDPPTTIDSWDITSGSLPPGLTLKKLNSYNSTISGTPTQEGTYSFTVRATKTYLGQPKPLTILKEYTLTVVRVQLTLQPQTIAAATEGSSYLAYITVSGGTEPYTWTVTGLETEVTGIAWRLSSGRTDRIELYGTPPIGSHGSRIVTVIVRDQKGLSTSKQYLLTIYELPWTYEVSLRCLTELRDESRAYVFLDELVFNRSLSRLAIPIYEVTVRRISGVGDKWFEIRTTNLPGFDLMYTGVDVSINPAAGYVGENPLTAIISINVDASLYPHLFEEKEIHRAIYVFSSGFTGVTKKLNATLKGIAADVRVNATPIQVIEGFDKLVAGKSTIFKVGVSIECNRCPVLANDIPIRVMLYLPNTEWTWETPEYAGSTVKSATATVVIPKRFTVDDRIRKCVSSAIVYVPTRLSNFTATGRMLYMVNGVWPAGFYYTAPYPLSMPRPSTEGVARASFSVQADILNIVREVNEDNNVFGSSQEVVRTKKIKILFFPWAENRTEMSGGMGAYSSTSAYIRDVVQPAVKTQVEFLQAIYPTAEAAILYNVYPSIFIRDLYATCSAQYTAFMRSYCPCDCNAPCNDACRRWCECSGNAAWSFLYGDGGIGKLADDAGYDFAVAFRVVGGGGCTWADSRPMAAYVDIHACYSGLSHEMYHVLGPMKYDDYSCPAANQCPAGYWVNKGEQVNKGRCYIMSACGGAPWWIQAEMYNLLLTGWFNPSGADPEAIRISGTIYRNGSGRLDPFRTRTSDRVALPGSTGNYSIVLLNSKGQELARYGLNASFAGEMYTDMYAFMFYATFNEEIHSVELRDSSGRVLATRDASSNRPQVSVTSPKAGEIVSNVTGTFLITWEGRDADGDLLYYTVLVSFDGGGTWIPLAGDITTSSFKWDPTPYEGSENYIVKVIVSDGFYSSESLSGRFKVGAYVRLDVESPYGKTEGSGWYLINQTAVFSVTPTKVEMSGILGTLGGYYEFTGWSGDTTSTSPSSKIVMDGNKKVVAQFKPNYTMPLLILAGVAIAALLIIVAGLKVKTKSGQKTLPPPPKN